MLVFAHHAFFYKSCFNQTIEKKLSSAHVTFLVLAIRLQLLFLQLLPSFQLLRLLLALITNLTIAMALDRF